MVLIHFVDSPCHNHEKFWVFFSFLLFSSASPVFFSFKNSSSDAHLKRFLMDREQSIIYCTFSVFSRTLISAVHATLSVLWLLCLKSDFNKNVYRWNVSPIYHVVFLLIRDKSLGTEFKNDCSTQMFACIFTSLFGFMELLADVLLGIKETAALWTSTNRNKRGLADQIPAHFFLPSLWLWETV